MNFNKKLFFLKKILPTHRCQAGSWQCALGRKNGPRVWGLSVFVFLHERVESLPQRVVGVAELVHRVGPRARALGSVAHPLDQLRIARRNPHEQVPVNKARETGVEQDLPGLLDREIRNAPGVAVEHAQALCGPVFQGFSELCPQYRHSVVVLKKLLVDRTWKRTREHGARFQVECTGLIENAEHLESAGHFFV